MSHASRSRTLVGGSIALLLVALLAVGAVGAVPLAASGPADTGVVQAQQANEPPTASFQYSPANPEPGEAVRLDASGSSDADGDIVSYQWDLDGDGEVDAESGNPNQRIAFPSAGTYEVTLTVTDDDGATDSTTQTIQVVGDQPPSAELTVSPQEIAVGETTTLDPSGSSDPDGQIVTWEYDTDGDGTIDETFDAPTTFKRNYAEAGTYEVTLRVTDNDGLTATTTATVVVEATSPTVTTAAPGGGQTSTSPGGQETSPAGQGDGDDGSGNGGLLPGGGLAIAALIGGFVVIAGGVVLYGRTGGRSPRTGSSSAWGGRGSSSEATGAATVGSVVAAIVLVALVVGAPAYLINQRYVSPAEGAADMAIALVQLVAIALLGLLVLLWALLQFVQRREEQLGRGPVVGALGGDQFRWVAFAFGFVATVLLTLGLATLLLAGTLPSHVTLAAGLILGAVSIVPLLLAVVLVSLTLG